jgi:hypothetical protein
MTKLWVTQIFAVVAGLVCIGADSDNAKVVSAR